MNYLIDYWSQLASLAAGIPIGSIITFYVKHKIDKLKEKKNITRNEIEKLFKLMEENDLMSSKYWGMDKTEECEIIARQITKKLSDIQSQFLAITEISPVVVFTLYWENSYQKYFHEVTSGNFQTTHKKRDVERISKILDRSLSLSQTLRNILITLSNQ